jgi:hypothetical protein
MPTYNGPSSGTYTIPTTGNYRIQCWGEGGNGQSGIPDVGGTGGGGGAYAEVTSVSLTAGDELGYEAYAGGSETGTVVALLGETVCFAEYATNGSGGTAAGSVGGIKYDGGNGAAGSEDFGGDGGSAASPSGNGTNGGANNGAGAGEEGGPGDDPGNGGGGGGGDGELGGVGGAGRIIVTLVSSMANPTTAKPSTVFSEHVSTGGTVGELMRAQVAFLLNGPPRDCVEDRLCEPFIGRLSHGAGSPPQITASWTSGDVTNDACAIFKAGTASLRLFARGFSGTPTYPFTMGCVVEINQGPTNTAKVVSLCCVGSDTSNGIGYQVATDGTITFGGVQGATFVTAGVTLTSGRKYLIATTYTSSTGRTVNIYDYTAQSAIATNTTFTDTAYNTAATRPDFNFNPGLLYTTLGIGAFIGKCYTYFLHTGTMNTGTNGYFNALVADPIIACRGTTAGGGTMTAAGGITEWDATSSSITIAANRPTGGVFASWSWRLHRSLTPSFTPDSTTAVTGYQSSPILVDTTAQPNANYWYKVEFYDGTTTLYSTTATRNRSQVAARTSRGVYLCGLMADSRYHSQSNSPVRFLQAVRSLGWRVGMVNEALSSSALYHATASLSWQPTALQAGTTLLTNFVTACNNAGVTRALIVLGINDAARTGAVSIAYLQNIIDHLHANGITNVDILKPALSTITSEANTLNTHDYRTLLDALDNGTTIRVFGDQLLAMNHETGLGPRTTDYLHEADTTYEGIGAALSLIGKLDPEALGLKVRNRPVNVGGGNSNY